MFGKLRERLITWALTQLVDDLEKIGPSGKRQAGAATLTWSFNGAKSEYDVIGESQAEAKPGKSEYEKLKEFAELVRKDNLEAPLVEPGFYVHYKNPTSDKMYAVLGTAVNRTDGEMREVVYVALHESDQVLHVRDLEEWHQPANVPRVETGQTHQVDRFIRVDAQGDPFMAAAAALARHYINRGA